VGEYRPSIRYGFVRARQLEGTFPGDKKTGAWPITGQRVDYGWGLPPEESWPYGGDWPPIEPPGIDLLAKDHRWGPYRRVRTLAACVDSVLAGESVGTSLDITDKWANPSGGRIPATSPTDIFLPPHHIVLDFYDRTRGEFKFWNSWGPLWGDQGYGYIRGEVLEATWWEAWKNTTHLLPKTPPHGSLPHPRSWTFKDSDGSVLHWLELVDKEDERMAWVSAVEHAAGLEIEELFVRPHYRGAGHGRNLFRTMHKIAEARCLPFRVWISFADTAPQNLKVIEKLISPVGLSIQASGVRWAPLVASPVWCLSGPVREFPYPEQPPSSPSELVKLAHEIVIGIGTGVAAAFLYDAIKSWLDPKSGKKIRAKLGDLELETSEVESDEFLKLLKVLQNVKEEAEIRSKILEAGITIRVIDSRRKKN
jgi:GNAT superfamily N-acetyltransferase